MTTLTNPEAEAPPLDKIRELPGSLYEAQVELLNMASKLDTAERNAQALRGELEKAQKERAYVIQRRDNDALGHRAVVSDFIAQRDRLIADLAALRQQLAAAQAEGDSWKRTAIDRGYERDAEERAKLDLRDERDQLRAQAERQTALVAAQQKALRDSHVGRHEVNNNLAYCSLCGTTWLNDADEFHGAGCIIADPTGQAALAQHRALQAERDRLASELQRYQCGERENQAGAKR